MLDLKDILASVISNAEKRYTEKLAQDTSKRTNEDPAIKAQAARETREEKVNEGGEKTASAFHVEKVASAVEYIVDNFDDLLPKGPLARALDKVANMPGEGAGSLEVTQASKRRADYAKKDKMAVTEDPVTPKEKKGPQGETAHTLHKRPGGPLLKKEPFINEPSGTSKEAAWSVVLSKLAGEDVSPKAKISAGSAKSTELKTWEAPDSPGTPKGHDQSGYGNENEKYIMSNDAARNYTKRDAKKEYIKSQLSQVFDEANPEKDTTLDRAWTRGRDTAKMAMSTGAKAALGVGAAGAATLGGVAALHHYGKKKDREEQESGANEENNYTAQKKLAEAVEEGCKCGGEGSCDYCKAKSAVMKKLAYYYKVAMDDGGGAAAVPPPGGEDPSLAAAAGGPPGAGGKPQLPPPPDCQCGGQGICPPCKKQQLQMIMMKAKMQGAPQESPGAGAGMLPSPAGGGGGLPPDQPPAM